MVLAGNYLAANNVQIKNLSYTAINGGTQYQLSFDISWENAWRLDGGVVHQDAVWFFAKYKTPANPNWQHLKLEANAVETAGQLEYKVTSDQIGAFIYLNTDKVGNVNSTQFTVKSDILPSPSSLADIKVFAVEMVKVPEGPFYVGDGTESSFLHNALYQEPTPHRVSESGPAIIGILSSTTTYNFSIDAFYSMKYEISKAQYLGFLNTLTLRQQDSLSWGLDLTQSLSNPLFQHQSPSTYNTLYCKNADGSTGAPTAPVEVYLDNGDNATVNEFEDGTEMAMNYLSTYHLFAYLDWAGLRPMREDEYEKACRGPLYPVPNEFAWGTPFINAIAPADTMANTPFKALVHDPNVANSGFLYRVGFAANANSNTRHLSSASYYGIMDLTGGVGEIVLSSSDQNDHLLNLHGDGKLGPAAENMVYDLDGHASFCYLAGGSFITNMQTHNLSATVSSGREGYQYWSKTREAGGRGVRSID